MLLKKILPRVKPGGFSLLELLLATSLVPIVAMVIFSNVTAGMRLWRAVNQSVLEEDLCIFRQKVSTDLARMVRFSTRPLMGSSVDISFASQVEAPEGLGGDRGLGRVSYYFDAAKKCVVRQSVHWSDLYKEAPGQSAVILQQVLSWQIEYYYYHSDQTAYGWSEEWDSTLTYLPAAIRMTCLVAGRKAPEVFTFRIPVGS